MAISWPFNSTVTQDGQGNPVYSRTYSADVLARILSKYFRNGVFSDVSTSLQTVAATGMNVTVKPGDALINGRHFYEESNRTLAVQAAHATLDRIDTVVLRLNLAVEALTIDLYVVKGTAAATPAAPALTRNVSVWELGLANLLITKASTTIPQQRITDTRTDSTRCGVVASIIGETDTTTYYAQIQADLAGFKAVEQAAFDEWFAGVQDILNEDAAGHLMNLMLYHAPITYTATLLASGWSANAPYTQTIAVNGVAATDTPTVDVVLDSVAATAKAQLEAYGFVGKIAAEDYAITAVCYDSKPTVNIPIILKIARNRTEASGDPSALITAETINMGDGYVGTVREAIDSFNTSIDQYWGWLNVIQADIVARGSYGVANGLDVLAQPTPNMSVLAQAGLYYGTDGHAYALQADVTVAINAAHATLPRIDIIYASSNGSSILSVGYLAGTPASTPSAPALPVGALFKMAEISVAAAATSIASTAILRSAKTIWMEAPIRPTMTNGATSNAADPVELIRDISGRVMIRGRCAGITTDNNIFTLPVGYRPKRTTLFYSFDSVGKVIVGYLGVSGGVYLYAAAGYASYVSLTGIIFSTVM